MPRKKLILTAIVLVLISGNVVFGVNYFLGRTEVQETQESLKKQQLNAKIINFLQLFIKKVLKAEGEISFEERLKLENTVRNLNDSEVLDQWEKFTKSRTEEEAQQRVKDLLDLLAKKISY